MPGYRGGGKPAGSSVPVYKIELQQNREDRPRYINLVTYEQRWVPIRVDGVAPDDQVEALRIVPVRRTYQWVVGEPGSEAFACTRVTELRWRDLKAQPAHREFLEQWVAHVKAQLAKVKKGGRQVKVEVVP